MSLQLTSLATIDTHVAQHGKPFVVSLSDDTHIFHFEPTGNWKATGILFVNRNGHQFRLIRQEDGKWLFCKTWNDIFAFESWMTEAQLIRKDPEELINLCGIGPQGSRQAFETLSLLPKGTTHRRKAVFRHEIFDVRFDVDNNRFTLTGPQGVNVQTFSGKVWESQDAAKWCLANMSAPLKPAAPAVPSPVDEQVQAELEESDLWGMF